MRGPHLPRVDIRLGEHAASQEDGDFMGINLIVLGLGPINRLHVERVTEEERDPLLGTEVSEPIPRENAFDADDEVLPIWSNGLQEWFRAGLHVPVQNDIPILVENPEIHGTSMQIDAAVKSVLFGVESHEASSFVSDGSGILQSVS